MWCLVDQGMVVEDEEAMAAEHELAAINYDKAAQGMTNYQ
jgi:hypothetical protein